MTEVSLNAGEVSYGLGARGPVVKNMQRALNELLGLSLTPDGQLGKISQSAIEQYQHANGIVEEKDERGICYGPRTQGRLAPYIAERFVTEADYRAAAAELKCEFAAVMAVCLTEAKEFGFLSTGFPVILFERHKFYKYLGEEKGPSFPPGISAMRPDICNTKAGGYVGGLGEVRRINAAIDINERAALKSASWGLFQLMGFNHKLCGYASVEEFVRDMKKSERLQLKAFVKFIANQPGLLNAIRAKDWATFAKLYNGADYAINQYDKKMASNYKVYAGK